MRENWKFDVAHARPLAAVEARDIELAERLARKPTPHPPLLLYGVVLFCFGMAAYLVGVLLVFPRYLLDLNRWLEPVSQAIVWYSGVPIVLGTVLALTDLLLFLDRKRPDVPVRYRPLADPASRSRSPPTTTRTASAPPSPTSSRTRSSAESSSSATTAATRPSPALSKPARLPITNISPATAAASIAA